jgi:repressor LexA
MGSMAIDEGLFMDTIQTDSMTELTPRQQEILEFIEAESQAGRVVPTLREIAKRFGFKSHRAAACHLAAIKAKGYVQWESRKARSLRAICGVAVHKRIVHIPLFGSIPAGFGQDSQQDADGCVSVNSETIGFTPTRTTFALRVTGDSMIGRHIIPGDVVLIEHRQEPQDGQVVAALIDGQTTLKTFVRGHGQAYLRSENPQYPNLIPAEELKIQGVVKALLRKAPMAKNRSEEQNHETES